MISAPVRRIALVGDNIGVPRLLRHVDAAFVTAMIAAEIRPQYLDELTEIAHSCGVPLLVQPRRAAGRTEDFVSRVRESGPDLLLCDSYSMLLPPELLAIPVAGAINVHGGLLPEYRGSNPIQWAIIEGATEAGVTIHFMDTRLDAGDIIARRRVPVSFTDTWLDVRSRVNDATDLLLSEQMPLILTGRAARHPQDESAARHHPRRTPEDGRIDWSWPVRDIYNLIRALVSPLAGAFSDANGERHVFDRYLTMAQVVALKQRESPAGQSTCGLRVIAAESNDPISFEVVDKDGGGLGHAELHSIDYDRGVASVRLQSTRRAPDGRTIAEAVAEFARRELRLPDVRISA